jgi:hypothetical protein
MSCGQRENAHATGAWRTWPLVILPSMAHSRTYLAPLWAELSGDGLVAGDTCPQRVACVSVGHHGKTAKRQRTIQGSRKLHRLGYLEAGSDAAGATGYDPLIVDEPALARPLAASVTQRIAFGERAGQKVRRIASGFGYEGESPTLKGPRCARLHGFSLHTNTQVSAHRRDQLERLIRSIRPAVWWRLSVLQRIPREMSCIPSPHPGQTARLGSSSRQGNSWRSWPPWCLCRGST